MKYEDYAAFERARLEEARRQGAKTEHEERRAELLRQLVEVLDAIEGQLSGDLAAELREELGRLAC